jgi:hypothetical protein
MEKVLQHGEGHVAKEAARLLDKMPEQEGLVRDAQGGAAQVLGGGSGSSEKAALLRRGEEAAMPSMSAQFTVGPACVDEC